MLNSGMKTKALGLLLVVISTLISGAQYVGNLTLVSPAGGSYSAGDNLIVQWVSSNIPPAAVIEIELRPTDRFSEIGGDAFVITNNSGTASAMLPFDKEDGEYMLVMHWNQDPPLGFGAYAESSPFILRERVVTITNFNRTSSSIAIGYNGGADGSVHEVILSTNLLDWTRSGIFITNSFRKWAFESQATQQFFKVSPLVPLRVYLTNTTVTVSIGGNVSAQAIASGRMPPYMYHWWAMDNAGNWQIVDQASDTFVFTPNTVGVWTVGCQVFGDSWHVSGPVTFDVTVTQ